MRFAVKRLSAVEVALRARRRGSPPTAPRSNQHEFNASHLRRALGFDGISEKVEGAFHLVLMLADGEAPIEETSSYALYNARAGQSLRSPEYRLYYRAKRLAGSASSGDLFVLLRPDEARTELVALVAKRGTQAEEDLMVALQIGPHEALQRFFSRDAQPASDDNVLARVLARASRDSTQG